MANKTAKHIKELGGVCVWDRAPAQTTENLLARLPVVEVWGIGPPVDQTAARVRHLDGQRPPRCERGKNQG
ncbi:hypothetical protein [Glutamicibacter arilaitensis]|uniref:hypothetical protein n=1 Tax=Glutamicibacter arilaitensis TaxID=256701 RepID=UPI003FD39CF5